MTLENAEPLITLASVSGQSIRAYADHAGQCLRTLLVRMIPRESLVFKTSGRFAGSQTSDAILLGGCRFDRHPARRGGSTAFALLDFWSRVATFARTWAASDETHVLARRGYDAHAIE